MNAHRWLERMTAKVEVDANGCWLWLGKKDIGTGYGRVRFRGAQIGAHRRMYELVNGPIPAGLQIDHLCRVRLCINPVHLEAVTPRENTMRSTAVTKKNAQKTACPQGHPYNDHNTYRRPDGGRDCRICQSRRSRAYKAAKRSGA